tara:strand:- start:18 stop:350 length:333 start_codon:yes stop_codon:yes gene_type:complete
MPSPRKRIGFLPRAQVQLIIDKLCEEENMSQSKVVGILVEESLAARGIFDPTIGRDFQANPNWKPQAKSLMKQDSTEAPIPQAMNAGSNEEALLAEFREFQQFKKMRGLN